jgi:hypothetical protein
LGVSVDFHLSFLLSAQLLSVSSCMAAGTGLMADQREVLRALDLHALALC